VLSAPRARRHPWGCASGALVLCTHVHSVQGVCRSRAPFCAQRSSYLPMGQSVSVDRDPADLKALFTLGQASSFPPSGVPAGGSSGGSGSSGPLPDGPVKHHVKAWKFEKNGRAVVDSPASLCNDQGYFALELQRTCSYLILHIQTEKGAGTEDPVDSAAAAATLEELAASASVSCTPRGLAIEVVSQSKVCGDDGAGPPMRYAVFVWHGVGVDPHVKARVFTKAFELDRQLRLGLLWQPPFFDALRKAVVLQSSPRKRGDGSHRSTTGGSTSITAVATDLEASADAVRRSHNRLLANLMDGASKGSKSATSGSSNSSPSRSVNGAQRFPRLGQSVCRSLGLTASPIAGAGSTMTSDSDGWLHGQRRLVAAGISPGTPEQGVPGANGAVGVPPAAGWCARPSPGPANSGAATYRGDGRDGVSVVPRLQLAAAPILGAALHLGSDEVGYPEEMDIDGMASEGEPGGRKRFRAADFVKARTGNAAGTDVAKNTVPKSARTDHGTLQSPRGNVETSPPMGQAPLRVRSANDDGAPLRVRGVMPSLNLAGVNNARRDIASRTEAPTMLNLEEINMSEEELINSYDPDNEENNYHLPPNLYKQLQLQQYRQVCSEVLEGALFIAGYQVASDFEYLRRLQISHIVNTAADICENCFPENFQYLTYYLKDSNNEEISLLFYRTLKWIDEAIQKGGRVLVHCREGISRSSTMVIAYLMWRCTMTFETAHEHIRKVRPICNPNTGFTCQLLMLGKKLGVGGAGNVQAGSSTDKLFRVGPYHPREPFLLLIPQTELPAGPTLDPRFGWAIQCQQRFILWIGSQVIDVEGCRVAAQQHIRWEEYFERRQCSLEEVHDGMEPPQFWQMLGLQGPPIDRSSIVAQRPDLDGDAETLSTRGERPIGGVTHSPGGTPLASSTASGAPLLPGSPPRGDNSARESAVHRVQLSPGALSPATGSPPGSLAAAATHAGGRQETPSLGKPVVFDLTPGARSEQPPSPGPVPEAMESMQLPPPAAST